MRAERYAWALLLAAGSPAGATAADAPVVQAPPVPIAADAAPDADLLEFLGEFHDAKGEFVDPFVIDSVGSVLDQAEREAKAKATTDRKTEETTDAKTGPVAPPAQPEKQP
jgi:hypothetical protein